MATKKLRSIDSDEPLIVLARGYARIWHGEESPRLFAKVMKMKTPSKLGMGNVDALVLPPGPPTAFYPRDGGGLLLRCEVGDNAKLAEAALALPARAWKPIKCRMTGGSHGAILVFKASNPGIRPNRGTKCLRITVEKKPWPHRYYGVAHARISKTIGGERVVGSVLRIAPKP